VKPRKLWDSHDYAIAQGRDIRTINVLKSQIQNGVLTKKAARQAAVDQGYDPDKVCPEEE